MASYSSGEARSLNGRGPRSNAPCRIAGTERTTEMMPKQPRKVLLVDDDPAYIERLERLLRQHGFQPCSASNGAAGLLAIHSEQPDLIVLDAEMPVMDGYLMLEVLLKDPHICRIPVILIT